MGMTCKAQRKDGLPCTVGAGEDGFCVFHSPTLQEARQVGAARGGRNKRSSVRTVKAMPSELAGVLDVLVTALDEVHRGELDARQAQAMASLANSISQLVRSHELERRIELIESDRSS